MMKREILADRGELRIFQAPKDTNFIESIQIPVLRWRLHVSKEFWVDHKEAPLWFWRKMQWLCLGFRWEKLE